MKSKRAEEFINNSSELIDGQEWMVDTSTARQAVELAERDAEEEVTHYSKELEESKRREELARKVIDDQRKKIEALKARTVEAFRESCPIKHPDLNDEGALCDKINIIGFDCNCPVSDCKFLLNFLQKLNEQ